jgi:lipocalin
MGFNPPTFSPYGRKFRGYQNPPTFSPYGRKFRGYQSHWFCKIFALWFGFLSFSSPFGLTPTTVEKVEIDKYLGDWYQVYGSPTNIIFQGYGKCITANYEMQPDGNISVLNSQLNVKNELEQITGYAYYTNASEPGKLTVHLDGTPVDAPYWIVSLGEVKYGKYQYSVVTSPSGISLWVLARNVKTFMQNYAEEVTTYLDEQGYKYVEIEQNPMKCSAAPPLHNLRSNYKSECQVASYLRNAGFSQSSLPTMVCISKYESSFNCDATNKNTDGSTDYGLMQINSYYWCSGDPISKYNECKISCSSLFDCQNNANCAYIVWKQQGYNAWYGYKYHKTECDNYKLNC